jgi:hypothetical protein
MSFRASILVRLANQKRSRGICFCLKWLAVREKLTPENVPGDDSDESGVIKNTRLLALWS